MVDSQTRQKSTIELQKKIESLKLDNALEEQQLSLFNKLFGLINLEKKDTTDTTSEKMRETLLETLKSNNGTKINSNNLDEALKILDNYVKNQPKPTIKNIKMVAENRQQSIDKDTPIQLSVSKQVPNKEQSKETNSQNANDMHDAFLTNVEIEDNPISYSDTARYVVINAMPLMSQKASDGFKIDYDLESTMDFFCFKDVNMAQDYQNRVINYKTRLKQLQEKADKTTIKSELVPILKEIKLLNSEIMNTYDIPETAAYSGYRIIRKNSFGRPTNQSAEAKKVEITTKQLNEKDALRIRLHSGRFLEIHLDENGNYDHTRPPIPLTAAGKEQPRLFSDLDADTRLIDNNYERTLEDLKFLDGLTINGEQVLPNIIESIEQKYAKQIIQQNPDLQDEFLDSEEPIEKQGNFTQKEMERTQSQSIDNSNLLV